MRGLLISKVPFASRWARPLAPRLAFMGALMSGSCAHQLPPAPARPTEPSEPAEEGARPAPGAVCSPGFSVAAPSLDDEQIEASIVLALIDDPSIAAASVHVKAQSGIVDLTGTTDNVLGKRRAVRHAELIKGVRGVVDRIEVRAPPVSDAQLAADVHHALAMDPGTNSRRISVGADHGIVTLSGKVDAFVEEQLAETVAAGVRGVSKVVNLLSIAPAHGRSDSEVQAEIGDRLRWDVRVDASETSVQVIDGVAYLRGRIGSAAERTLAFADAWVDGVTRVDASELYVSPPAAGHAAHTRSFALHPSDEQVARALRDTLASDPRVRTGDVAVTFEGGVAVLEGAVDTLKAKRAAEQDAHDTVGVGRVENRIDVRSREAVEDREIERGVEIALALNPRTAGYPITVEAHDGLVVLHGAVRSYFERAQAEDLSAGVIGVKQVRDELEVNGSVSPYVRNPYLYPYEPLGPDRSAPAQPTASDTEIEQAIVRRLQTSPFVSAEEIRVCVDNGEAELSGFADDQRAYDAATRIAYEGGAVGVDNRLTVR